MHHCPAERVHLLRRHVVVVRDVLDGLPGLPQVGDGLDPWTVTRLAATTGRPWPNPGSITTGTEAGYCLSRRLEGKSSPGSQVR